MAKLISILLFFLSITTPALAQNGVISILSSSDVTSTSQRLAKALAANDLHIFAKIDHQAGAQAVGQELRPTLLFIFGNPKGGTPLMQCQQTMALDLPQKMLIYQDEQGQTWISYNDPSFLAYRHNLGYCGIKVVEKIATTLDRVAHSAAQQPTKK